MNTQSQSRVYPINRYTSIKQFNGDMQAYTIDNFEHNHRYTHYENGTIGRLIDDVTADGLELKSFMISWRSFVNGQNDIIGTISFSFEKASELNKKIDNKEDFLFFYL